jgi:large subunit ribosomal protein L3
VTALKVPVNVVVAEQAASPSGERVVEVGYGEKKLSRMTKPLATKVTKTGLKKGMHAFAGVHLAADDTSATVGTQLKLQDVLHVGDVVDVQGTSKGRGFSGVVRRHHFLGGPVTHGQSDRLRAPGSIGQRQTPGRVFKGKRMAGHLGVDTVTVKGLTVLYIDPTEQVLWVSGPVPGALSGFVRITKTDRKSTMQLDAKASGVRLAAHPAIDTVAESAVPVESLATEPTPTDSTTTQEGQATS